MTEILQRIFNTVNIFILIIVILNSTHINGQGNQDKIPESDLTFLYQTLIEKHPKLHLIKYKSSFDSLFHETKKHFGQLNRNEAILRMMKFVASLKDGHTSIARIWDDKTGFKRLPFRLYLFSEGLHISIADKKYQNYTGMKVVGIGETKIEDVIETARTYIHGDNEMAFKNVLPNRLSQYDFLIGLKLGNKDGSVSFKLEDLKGKHHKLIIFSSDLKDTYQMVSARKKGVKRPLYLIDKGNYWHTYMEEKKLMYFQFNAVSEMKDKSFKKYIKELFTQIDSLPINKLVIDIRNNNGGDNSILQPLIHAIIRSDKINKKGHLFTVIGRLTFSAAVSLTTELETHTKTIFVGEPTSASPNHYGETRLGELPISKIKFLYSSQFWQGSLPWDNREWIEPSIKTHKSIKDYINGKDPSLERIINYKVK